ncbi:hypothetical protein KZY98_14325 [Croceibacter atlanticus]|uniref:hypothetical protein n=1 Tax=Croceibacter atlanticus TaxID=313588 RepID=UPI001C5D72F0|nr:hypothetical protein [Croceibacter atlanticus]MBW4971633.1 hypothetical protein [Croceibacter atlanticus]
MKDPRDKKTVDGCADLVAQVESTPLRKKPGRKPSGEKALTPAEKQKAYRDRRRDEKAAAEAAKAQGLPPTSSVLDLTTSFASLIR